MGRVSFLLGVLVASCLAGAMLLMPPVLYDSVLRPDRLQLAGITLRVMFFAMLLGFVFAFPVNLVAAASLAMGGRNRPGWRRWSVWLATGAAIGAAIGLLLVWRMQLPLTSMGVVAVMAVLGLANAAVCRWFTRWRD